MENLTTTDEILDFIQTQTENRMSITPEAWLKLAGKLNALVGNETDRLAVLKREIAEAKIMAMEGMEKPSVAKAELVVQATPLSEAYEKLKYKIDRVNETVRIAKKMATLKNEELGNY